MLRACIGFFVIGLIAYVLGAYNIGGVSIELGRIILFAFLVISLLGVVVSLVTGKGPRHIS